MKDTVRPSTDCYAIAKRNKCTEYKRVVQNLNQFKQCLIEGYPFIFGITVYE